ncbi:MAG: crossover junction endodeoxyribonuclease RuvC [Planctomycetes bacterium]|nr:crossover junction endodeoxyribonuclease RuvC [Planctomycetota bacterium]
MADSPRILAIDPGTRRVGWAVVESVGGRLRLVEGGVIRADRQSDYAPRLALIMREIQQIIAKLRPAEAAIETAFAGRNVSAALKIGEGRGVAIAACGVAGLPVFEYAARLVKRAATGRGGADKSQVAAMVALQMGLGREKLPPDLTDACAVAITHFNRRTNPSRTPGTPPGGAGRRPPANRAGRAGNPARRNS